jgi:hypothetical protein
LPNALRFGTTRAGETQAFTELPKGSIEEVSLRTAAEGGGQLYVLGIRVGRGAPASAVVRVRTDHDVVRLGRRLAPDAKVWLRDAIAGCVSSGASTAPPPRRTRG